MSAWRTTPPRGPRVLIAALVVIALLAVGLRTLDRGGPRVSKDEAVATARAQIDFEPERTGVRLIRQGVKSQPVWAVSLVPEDDAAPVVTILVDGRSGVVREVQRVEQ